MKRPGQKILMPYPTTTCGPRCCFCHCQNVTDHFPCLPNFLLLNAKSKSWSRTDEICPHDRHVKFKNNTSGRERLWDTALKFLCPGLFITSPDHLECILRFFWCFQGIHTLQSRAQFQGTSCMLHCELSSLFVIGITLRSLAPSLGITWL